MAMSYQEYFARPLDPYEMRRRFPEWWAGYLRAHYRGDARLIALVFGVTAATAGNWLSEACAPRADVVALEDAAHPGRLIAWIADRRRAA